VILAENFQLTAGEKAFALLPGSVRVICVSTVFFIGPVILDVIKKATGKKMSIQLRGQTIITYLASLPSSAAVLIIQVIFLCLKSLTDKGPWTRSFLFLLVFVFAILPNRASSMEAKIIQDTLILSGPVIQGDIQRFENSIASNSNVKTVVLRNSWGGHIESGYRIGERIRELGISTVVSGHCVSSCSRMFLGGVERRFSNDFGLERTFVGFHGHYDSTGKLNRALVERWNLAQWTIKHSDGKADPELVQRWVSIELNTGMVAFMHPITSPLFRSEKTFMCMGREANRPLSCRTIPETALNMGVITDLTVVRSPDQ